MGKSDTTGGPAWVCHGCGADLGCCSYLIRDGYYLCARCAAARVTPFVADDHACCRAALATVERDRDAARAEVDRLRERVREIATVLVRVGHDYMSARHVEACRHCQALAASHGDGSGEGD